MSKISVLEARRDAFGPLVELDFSYFGFIEAHQALGKEVQDQAKKILASKIESLEGFELENKILQGRACRNLLWTKSRQTNLNLVLTRAIGEYLACLEAWASGVGLDEYESQHPLQAVNGQRVIGIDLAWLLQNDSTGCQTGLYRCKDGGVILWHAEEDVAEPGERFDKLRIAKFVLPLEKSEVELQAFIYPDLLPGCAFAWRGDGYVQAVDTLVLYSLPLFEQAALVNVISWLTWRIGSELELKKIVEALAPYWDGYALNSAFVNGETVKAEKCEFARDQVKYSHLDEAFGSYQIQVNFFSDRRNGTLQEIEALPKDRLRSNADRLNRTRRLLARKNLFKSKSHSNIISQGLKAFEYSFEVKEHEIKDNPSIDLTYFYNLLGSRSGGEMAYANTDVRAWILVDLSLQGMIVWIGPGAVICS